MANQTELLNVSDEMKLDDDRQNFCEELGAEELCSSSLDTTEELYSSSVPDTCGDGLFTLEEIASYAGLRALLKETYLQKMAKKYVHESRK